MKKQFTIIHNQQGFLLLHVVWVILIVLLSLHFLLYQYQTGKVIAHNQLFHIEVETLFQMAYQKFRDEVDTEEISLSYQAVYDFPQGQVTVTFLEEANNTVYIVFSIKQTGDDHVYLLARPYSLKDNN
ncbi:hypothetical protein [Oceanobacillus sp. CFH 90083]|uniref:hypothetical protein n=1 Tax=Oceanobacillus sp. CFH 90083 TaxID=2592336 RepID=UPI00128B567B|nr:hypothetical protein [Oceanobacillus sp. CFH 90083]